MHLSFFSNLFTNCCVSFDEDSTAAKKDRASLFSKESVVQLSLADLMENHEFQPQLALYIESLQHPLNMFPSSLSRPLLGDQ